MSFSGGMGLSSVTMLFRRQRECRSQSPAHTSAVPSRLPIAAPAIAPPEICAFELGRSTDEVVLGLKSCLRAAGYEMFEPPVSLSDRCQKTVGLFLECNAGLTIPQSWQKSEMALRKAEHLHRRRFPIAKRTNQRYLRPSFGNHTAHCPKGCSLYLLP